MSTDVGLDLNLIVCHASICAVHVWDAGAEAMQRDFRLGGGQVLALGDLLGREGLPAQAWLDRDCAARPCLFRDRFGRSSDRIVTAIFSACRLNA